VATRPPARGSAEQLELQRGRINGEAHQPPASISHEVTSSRPANRGIAGHQRHGLRRERAESDTWQPGAAAHAASHPAWPAPMMTTSNPETAIATTDAEPGEDVMQQIVGRARR
jgi:hypothetical protein